MTAMRAHARGGPEQLVYERAPARVPGLGEVLVAVITFAELTWDLSWTTKDGRDRNAGHPLARDVRHGRRDRGVTGGAAAENVTVPARELAAEPPLGLARGDGHAANRGAWGAQVLDAACGLSVPAGGWSHSAPRHRKSRPSRSACTLCSSLSLPAPPSWRGWLTWPTTANCARPSARPSRSGSGKGGMIKER